MPPYDHLKRVPGVPLVKHDISTPKRPLPSAVNRPLYNRRIEATKQERLLHGHKDTRDHFSRLHFVVKQGLVNYDPHVRRSEPPRRLRIAPERPSLAPPGEVLRLGLAERRCRRFAVQVLGGDRAPVSTRP